MDVRTHTAVLCSVARDVERLRCGRLKCQLNQPADNHPSDDDDDDDDASSNSVVSSVPVHSIDRYYDLLRRWIYIALRDGSETAVHVLGRALDALLGSRIPMRLELFASSADCGEKGQEQRSLLLPHRPVLLLTSELCRALSTCALHMQAVRLTHLLSLQQCDAQRGRGGGEGGAGDGQAPDDDDACRFVQTICQGSVDGRTCGAALLAVHLCVDADVGCVALWLKWLSRARAASLWCAEAVDGRGCVLEEEEEEEEEEEDGSGEERDDGLVCVDHCCRWFCWPREAWKRD